MNRLSNIDKQLSSNSLHQIKPAAYQWVQTLVNPHPFSQDFKLKNKTIVISGGSRGIGLAIALRCAKDGAKVAILAKTVTENPKLPGTIFSAAKEIEQAGGKALPVNCDIRKEEDVDRAVAEVIKTFGTIDILINNASAISLTDTLSTDMKKYDLMNQVDARGTFMLSKKCLPYLLKSENAHILTLSPPLNMDSKWFANNLAYSIAKYGMSMCTLGLASEFQGKVAANSLWPRTAIATAAVGNLLGGDEALRISRTAEIMADSAYIILTSNKNVTTGKFFIDDEVLASVGQVDFTKYKVDKNVKDFELAPDFFI